MGDNEEKLAKFTENFKGVSLPTNPHQLTKGAPRTVGRSSIPFAPMSAAASAAAPAAAALASNVPPQTKPSGLPPIHPGASAASAASAAASEAARGEDEPYTFNYVLQFQIAGYDRQTLINFERKREYAATPFVKTIITLLQIPHFRAHSYSANTTETTTTRYYVNKATYLQHIEQNPSVLPFVRSHRFMAFDVPMGERQFALRMGDQMRAGKAGGKRRVKRHTRVKRTKKYKTRKYRR
jgi:hypothetical protein